MSDFETYRKRQERLKALEHLLSTAKAYLASGKMPDRSDRIKAIYDLQKAIEEVDKCPAPHLSLIKS